MSCAPMEHRPQLPPITTHFAEFFPRTSTQSALVTPPKSSSQSSTRPLKRKRSDPEYFDGNPPRPSEAEAATRPRDPPTYRSGEVGEPEHKRFASYHPRDQEQRNTKPEPSDPGEVRDRPLTSPRRHSIYESRPAQIDPGSGPPRGDRISHSRPQSVDWLSNVREPSVPESKVLPPFSRPRSPQAAAPPPDDRWRDRWRGGPEHFPAPMEPKTSYYQLQPTDKADTILAGKTATTDPPRMASYTSAPSGPPAPQSQLSEPRHSTSSSRHYGPTAITSPSRASPPPRGPPLMQSTPPQRIATESRMPHGGFSNSASDSSPVSARVPPGSPQRYTWDAPGLYEHSHRKRRGNLPKESTALLTDWFNKHSSYPYPKEAEKQALQAQTGLAMSQISNWFVNARRRRRPSLSTRTEPTHHQRTPSARDREPLHVPRYR